MDSPGASSDVSEEYDMVIAKKATETLTSEIVAVLHTEIGAVLDKARGHQLIGPEMYSENINSSDSKQVARKFLEVAMGHCYFDSSKWPKLLSIFEEIPSLDVISVNLKAKMRELAKAPLHSISVASDTPSSKDYDRFSSVSSTTSSGMSSFKQDSSQELLTHPLQLKNTLKGGSTDEENQVSSSEIQEPHIFLDKGRRSFKTVTAEIETIKRATRTFEQVKGTDFSEGPSEVKEASESLQTDMKDSTKYEVYLALMKKRQKEMDELEEKYDKERQELKRKYETNEESASLIKEEEDLKSKYSRDAQQYAEVGQLLEDHVQLQTDKSKVITLQVAIQYEKKINELNKEIGSLKDIIASQKDDIAQLRLSMKDQEVQELRKEIEHLKKT